jgi:hypothetical protein
MKLAGLRTEWFSSGKYNNLPGMVSFFFMAGNNKGYPASIIANLYVAAFLAYAIISTLFKGLDNLFAGKQGRLGHTATSKTLWSAEGLISPGSGSKYRVIASLIFLIASCSVLP